MISSHSSTPIQPQTPMPVMNMPPPAADNAINLLDLWQILMRAKWLIILVTLLCSAGAAALAWTAIPIYQAEILLEPISEEAKRGGGALAQLGGLAAMAGINLGGGGSSKASALAKLKSRVFAEEFVRDENLMPELFDEHWDKTAKKWKNPLKIPLLAAGVDTFRGVLKTQEDKQTGLLTLTIDWKNPDLASRWANLVVERINTHLRTLAIDEARKNIDYLNLELSKTQIVEIKQAIAGLLEAQIKKIMLANASNEYAFKVIDPAIVPEVPIKPRRKLMIFMGVFTGGMLGIFAAFFRHFLRQSKASAKASVSAQPVR